MIYDFSADDIFEMAEQLERNGAKFYRTAAEGLSDSPAKKLLLELSKMEDAHEKTFASLRADLVKKERTSSVFDPEGEAMAYLRALADTRVFFEKTVDVSSLKLIYMAALEAEKDSIVFYLGMKDMVPQTFGKERIDAIIREEMGHIRILSRELTSLKRSTE
ncbi:MAG: ferritin family protein [Desulfobacterales bacterium]